MLRSDGLNDLSAHSGDFLVPKLSTRYTCNTNFESTKFLIVYYKVDNFLLKLSIADAASAKIPTEMASNFSKLFPGLL